MKKCSGKDALKIKAKMGIPFSSFFELREIHDDAEPGVRITE